MEDPSPRSRPSQTRAAGALAAGVLGAAGCAHLPPIAALQYPETRRGDQVDDYHGTPVADPYRWLEEGESDETREWIAAQNDVTFAYLHGLPERGAYLRRLTQLWDHEKYGVPRREGDRYFFTRHDGLRDQSVLYVADALDAESRVLLDPNGLSADGTVALKGTSPSPDGRLLAYSLSTAGSDWEEWRVRDVDTGEDLPDRLEWVKFSGVSWDRDGSGFFYSRYAAPQEGDAYSGVNLNQKLYHHRMGTPQSEDRLIYERPDEPEWGFGGTVSEDDRYLFIGVWRGTEQKNLLFYRDRTVEGAPVVELVAGFEASFDVLGNVGPVVYLRTNLDAPRGRVVAVDLARPERENWREVLPQDEETLSSAALVGGRLLTSYLVDAHEVVRIHDIEGRLQSVVELPAVGSVWVLGGRADDPESFFIFTSFTTPAEVHRLDVSTGETTLFRRPDVDVDPSDFVVRQVFYESRDGTRVPMFVAHHKDVKPDGRNPTLLYGYGGFNIPITPSFSVANQVWMERGGVYAVANIRGGGEYGEEWHLAGTKERKQNSFDDFIAAAEWLCRAGYTTPAHLGIAGGSNGGLLVGACMTQRPELFGACVPAVGVMDMLRYDKFTIGWAWTSDYGDPDDPDAFAYLWAYSPLHNLRKGVCYPPTLVVTGDHDDRVVPAHSFKFAAELQRVQGCENPVLIRIETRAGHGVGKPTRKILDEAADRLAFLHHHLSPSR